MPFFWKPGRAGAEIVDENGNYLYPSYVRRTLMGPLFFDYGFGPFRWVCTSSDPADLEATDSIAAGVLEDIARDSSSGDPEAVGRQYPLDQGSREKQACRWFTGENSLCRQ